ncbi:hypothetical protein GCM10027062_15030 [Nocardioides hungaricus]
MKGDIVYSPAGEKITLVDIGLVELLNNEIVRVWDVSLGPGEVHPWHLHHNPYVVLSLQGSEGRMDWLDGSPPRFISEYTGGAVYRPVSPIHRLTNVGERFYRNRLVELKDIGEHLPAPLPIGEGARSIEGEVVGEPLDDGRVPVLEHPHVAVWTIVLEPGESRELALSDVGHVLAELDQPAVSAATPGGVRYHHGGPLTLTNVGDRHRTWFVVQLCYLDDLDAVVGGVSR